MDLDRLLGHDEAVLSQPLPAAERAVALPEDPELRPLAETWNALGTLLELVGEIMELDPYVLAAVVQTEMSSPGFTDDHLAIRFDQGQFQREVDASLRERAGNLDVDLKNPGMEWTALEFARSLDEEAALRATSMGRSQVLGAHHEELGYASAAEMFKVFSLEERRQVLGGFDYIRSQRMDELLRERAFRTFVARYGGASGAEARGEQLTRYVDALTQLGSPGPSIDLSQTASGAATKAPPAASDVGASQDLPEATTAASARVISDVAGGDDLINAQETARPFAEMIARTDLQPPLSIGLFGDWGAGKSFLMGEMRRQIEEITERRHPRIRHVVFNAWHYAGEDI